MTLLWLRSWRTQRVLDLAVKQEMIGGSVLLGAELLGASAPIPQAIQMYGTGDGKCPMQWSGAGQVRCARPVESQKRVLENVVGVLLASGQAQAEPIQPRSHQGVELVEYSVFTLCVALHQRIFTTLIPNTDPCAFGGDSWLMELGAFYGGRLDYSVFDLDDDGDFDHDDHA